MVGRERQEYLGTKSEGHRSKMPEGAAAAVARDLHALGHSGANRMSMTGADGPVCCPEEPARGTAATGATSARYVLGGIIWEALGKGRRLGLIPCVRNAPDQRGGGSWTHILLSQHIQLSMCSRN